jgi:muramoyltetrapeptide carboxypeptidase LdcA involved in peptidoglycan recycling
MGYSDTTTNHLMCYKAGLSSIYGPAILTDFAENIQMPDYTVQWLKKTLFSTEPIGEITPSEVWTSEMLRWVINNKETSRKFESNTHHELLQGSGIIRGHLIGGCMDVFDLLRGTELFPSLDDFSDAILFLEMSEEMPTPSSVLYSIRTYGAIGILGQINGIVIGKPFYNKYYDEYKREIAKVLLEYGQADMPVLYNLSYGHCEPKFCIPYGAIAEIDLIYSDKEVVSTSISRVRLIRLQ